MSGSITLTIRTFSRGLTTISTGFMSSSSRVATTAVSALFGGAAGVAVTVFAVQTPRAPVAQQPPGSAAAAPTTNPPSYLEARVAQLESQSKNPQSVSQGVNPASPTSAEHPVAASPQTPEDELRLHHEAIARHEKEPFDPAWSPTATKSLQSDLLRITKAAGFSYVSADCRDVTCVAKIEFNDYDDANKKWALLIHERYDLNCAVRVVMDPPKDPKFRYETSVLYDCSMLRN